MKNTIITILKKELKRFFSDKRMAFSTVLMPGIMIFVLYNFMGDAINNMVTVDDNYVYQIESTNMPGDIKTMMDSAGIASKITDIDAGSAEKAKEKISNDESGLDLYLVFPENFESDVATYDSTSGNKAPQVEVYYNSASTESQAVYGMFIEMMDSYEAAMTNKFDINADESVKYDLASENDAAASVFSSMLPMLLLMFVFSACMAVGPESISGEKERGTIATMLVTPAKRSHIALGKIMALSIIALLSGLSSTVGTMLSLPKIANVGESDIKTNVYGVSDYLLLAVVILAAVLLIVTLISIISAFAKSTKEANTYITPLMIVVMLVGLSGMFIDGTKTELYYYVIPIYNSVQAMTGIFSLDIMPSGMIVSVISNIIYTGIGVFVLTRMFNNEKIMFNK
ncbi:MAG: ABC transporter permease subunit [Lachnospiraceae bacterium]|jgi:sodium transport system permease protein|nr:ABC transporter permease [Lachnospiraceae bacterium]